MADAPAPKVPEQPKSTVRVGLEMTGVGMVVVLSAVLVGGFGFLLLSASGAACGAAALGYRMVVGQ